MKFARPIRPGDYVVYRVSKRSAHPGERAKDIEPERHGEGYLYTVDKFWVVNERRGANVVLMTRRGKIHVVDENDPSLHRPWWWQRLVYRDRFPKPLPASDQNDLSIPHQP